MARPVAPLPKVKSSIAVRVLAKIDNVDEDDLDLYLEQQLVKIMEENLLAGAALEINRERARQEFGEEAGQTALRAGISMYQILKQQTIFNYRNIFLRAKLFQQSKEKPAALTH